MRRKKCNYKIHVHHTCEDALNAEHVAVAESKGQSYRHEYTAGAADG